MGLYEKICMENNHIEIEEVSFLPSFQSGCYANGSIFIKPNLSETRKAEILYEELSHHKLTYGDITDQSQFNNRKFERYAVRDSYECALPLKDIVNAYKENVRNLFELAEYVQLSEEFVMDVIEHYKLKYGLSTFCGEHKVELEPLRVFEYHNW